MERWKTTPRGVGFPLGRAYLPARSAAAAGGLAGVVGIGFGELAGGGAADEGVAALALIWPLPNCHCKFLLVVLRHRTRLSGFIQMDWGRFSSKARLPLVVPFADLSNFAVTLPPYCFCLLSPVARESGLKCKLRFLRPKTTGCLPVCCAGKMIGFMWMFREVRWSCEIGLPMNAC